MVDMEVVGMDMRGSATIVGSCSCLSLRIFPRYFFKDSKLSNVFGISTTSALKPPKLLGCSCLLLFWSCSLLMRDFLSCSCLCLARRILILGTAGARDSGAWVTVGVMVIVCQVGVGVISTVLEIVDVTVWT